MTVPIPITLMRNIQGNYVINGSYLGLLSSKTQLMNKNTILGNFILKKNIFPDFQAERDEKENSFLLKFRGQRIESHSDFTLIKNFMLQLKIPCCFPCSSVGKESACSAGDPGSIPGLGRSPGEGNGNPLQYPCLENLMDKGA